MDIPNRLDVTSSNISFIGYDDSKKELYIGFVNKGLYKYFDFDQSTWETFKNSESKGTYFHREIKTAGYEYKKV